MLSEARSSASLEDLRAYFDRVHEIRRAHSDDFDVQVLTAELQEEIIERARTLRAAALPLEATGAQRPAIAPSPAAKPADEPSDAAEIPPEVPRLDKKTWQRSLFLSLFLTAVVLAAFFYLIQAARRINLPKPQTETPTPVAKTTPAQTSPNPAATPASTTPIVPTLRLYTDLVPGSVSIDGGEPKELSDGELTLDHLDEGRHTIKVSGNSGSANFAFKVEGKSAPQVVGAPSASNALAVLFSAEHGKGRLTTNAEHSSLLLDGKPVGEVTADGLTLDGLGTTDHDLQLNRENDRQRFVWTYTPAPVLTVYVKSDPNVGTAVVMTQLDGVGVWINDKPLRRLTQRGEVRIPLKVGEYTIRVHKEGYIDPPPQSVEVKKAEETAVQFSLEPAPAIATLQIKDAQPGTAIYMDKQPAGTVTADGAATIPNIKPGEHAIELRHDQFAPKVLPRVFDSGKTVVLSGDEVKLEPAADARNAPPPPQPAAPAPAEKSSTTPNTAVDIEGEQVRKGGGFIPYHVPKAPGRYSFSAHSRIGGFLKHSKLQWYAGYLDSQNYVLFTIDGKHAIVREIRDGKPVEVNRIPFNADSNQWVQVDLSVSPDSIDARVRTPDAPWNDVGTVSSQGRDFTQGKVGFYVPGSDEIAIANFRFTNR